MPFKFNRSTLLANIFSLQFTEISEYHPSSSYRASISRFFPYIHCKFGHICPTTKMASATVKSPILIGEFTLRLQYMAFNVRQNFRGVARGGSWGARDPPFVSHVLSKQSATGSKNNMKIWWETSFWHRVTPPLKIPGYAHDFACIFGIRCCRFTICTYICN